MKIFETCSLFLLAVGSAMSQPRVVTVPWGDAAPQRIAYSRSGNLWAVVGKQIYYQVSPGGAYALVPGELNSTTSWPFRSVNSGLIKMASFAPEDDRLFFGQKKQPDSAAVAYWDMIWEASKSGLRPVCDEKSFTFDGSLGTTKTIGNLFGPWPTYDGRYLMAAVKNGQSTVYSALRGACNFTSVINIDGEIVQVWKTGANQYVAEKGLTKDPTNPITEVVLINGSVIEALASTNLSTNPRIPGRAGTPCTLAADGYNATAVIACADTNWDARALFIKEGKVSEVYKTAGDFNLKVAITALAVSGDQILLGGDDYQPYVMWTLLAKNAASGSVSLVGKIRRDGDMVGGVAPNSFRPNMTAVSSRGNVSFAFYGINSGSKCFLLQYDAAVIERPKAKISVDKTEVGAGESVKISWSVQGADVVTLQGYGPVAPVGDMTVNPTETTLFTLTASNAAGVEIMTTTVTVKTAPPTRSAGRGLSGESFPQRPHREQ